MTEQNPPSVGQDGDPVPRDLPDQQASGDADPWDVTEETATTGNAPDSDNDVPDTSEAGTGRRGTPDPHEPDQDSPQPEESSG
ncbi:hypothetical protein [Streptomyces sp. NPDC052114]|uniref:hypothetical protein n=1 Tax=unclassified Streptomyces TaxID=2593676 RepID=UPI003417F2AC